MKNNRDAWPDDKEYNSMRGLNFNKVSPRLAHTTGKLGSPGGERVLIVDDEASVRCITAKILEFHKYKVTVAANAQEALGLVGHQTFDLVISDISMPGMNGLEFLETLKQCAPLTTAVVMTGTGTAVMAVRAMKCGAQGFIPKPFTEGELLATIQTALHEAGLRRENMAMKLYMPLLEKTNAALLNAMEAKDRDSQGHSQRVALTTTRMAIQLNLNEQTRTQFYFGALFHDIGKIGIPDSILRKSGPLTPEESREMARHPEIGAHIINTAKGMDEAARIILHHHERYDGTGYPDGLKGNAIPAGARIVAVADAYEEMISRRIYADGASPQEAIAELIKGKGLQYDPALVDCFVELASETLDESA